MKQSDLKCRDRYNQTDRIPHKELSSKQKFWGAVIWIASMVIGIPLILWLVDLLMPIN